MFVRHHIFHAVSCFSIVLQSETNFRCLFESLHDMFTRKRTPLAGPRVQGRVAVVSCGSNANALDALDYSTYLLEHTAGCDAWVEARITSASYLSAR